MAYKQFYDIDYTSVKSRLKTYLSQQTALKDYNFEGSAISTWLNFASYIIVYISSILNFIGNEMFIQSAQLEENVYKSAYQLNYLPRRKSAPKIILRVTNTSSNAIMLPIYTQILMQAINLSTVQEYTIPANSYLDVEAYEGIWTVFNHTYEGADFESMFLADKESVDQTHFFVYVESVLWKSVFEQQNYYLANNYFIRYLERFEISFDKSNGFFNVPNVGDSIQVKYLNTNGSMNNGLTSNQPLAFQTAFTNSSLLTIATTDTLKDGLDEEELTSVANNAPLFFSAAGRCVTEDDYLYKIRELPLYNNMADMVVYSSHRDVVTLADEYPTAELTLSDKLDKGFFIFSGLRRVINESLDVAYTFMTTAEKQTVVNFFNPVKFMQVFGKYRTPNIIRLLPTITVKMLRNFDIDRESFELSIHNYMETFVGFNKSFNISDLISFVKLFEFVNYCSVTYKKYVTFSKPNIHLSLNNVTGLSIGNTISSVGGSVATGIIVDIFADKSQILVMRTGTNLFSNGMTINNGTVTKTVSNIFNYNVIRIGSPIVPGSVSGSADSVNITDNSSGAMLIDGVSKGTIDYTTGYIILQDYFKYDTYNTVSFEVEFVEDIAVEFNKETFLDHTKAIVEYI